MVKLVIFFIFTILFSLGVSWFLDNDGSVSMTWLGYQIDTTIMFLVGSVASTFIAVIILVYFVRSLLLIPKRIKNKGDVKKSDLAIKSLTRTIAAIEMGDADMAKTSMKETKKLYNGKENIYPLIHLLEANVYGLRKEFQLANEHYNALLENKDTELVALHGLLKQASEEGDYAKAILLAEKAAGKHPNSKAVITLLLGLYKKSCKWEQYNNQLEKYKKSFKKVKNDEKPLNWEREKALALCMLAAAKYNDEENETACSLLVESNKFDKSFLPTAILLVEIADITDNKRKSAAVIEQIWKLNPYYELGRKYVILFDDENVKKRLKRAKKLLSLNSDSYYSNLIIAEEYISNGNYDDARSNIESAIEKNGGESKSICTSMIKIEQSEERQNVENIKLWETKLQYAKKDTIWKCNSCGTIHDKWNVKCSNCEAVDNIDVCDSGSESSDKSILTIT